MKEIVKKIHYVWLGGKPLPPSVKYCISSWRKKCPSYEIIQWDETNFDVDMYCWVREALQRKQYAFAADVIRCLVLQKYGGLYLDTDVELMKCVDDTISNNFVVGFLNNHYKTDMMSHIDENGIDTRTGKQISGFGINTGFIYSAPNHPVINKLLSDVYGGGNRCFVNEDGTFNKLIIDGELMMILHDSFGLKFYDITQQTKEYTVYESLIIASPITKNKNSIAIHWLDQTWVESNQILKKIKKAIKAKHPKLYRRLYSLISG